MKRKLLWMAALWMAFAVQMLAQNFSEATSGLPTKMPFGTSVADFDGDGKFDILCFDGTDTNFFPTLYQNTTGVSFSRVTPVWSGNTGGTTQTFWADDNGDGLLDLIMTGDDDARRPVARIYWQNPDHTFAEHPVNLPGVVSGWRDLDNDGRLDVLISGTVAWKEADGSYTLSTVLTGGEIWDAADLDGDGDLDLLTTRGTIFRNDGSRRFANTGVTLYFPTAVADVDGDGRLDVLSNQPDLVNGRQTFSDRLPIVFRNEGSFNFSSNAIPTGTHYYRAGAIGDITGDAKPDMILVLTQFGAGFPLVAFANTNGSFLPSSSTFSANSSDAASLILADFDGDGDLDVLGSGQRRRLFRNTSTATRDVAAPTNLRSRTNRDAVELGWNAEPQNGATSFNIRIGTTPGGNEVVSSESTPTGRRMVARMGNAQTSGHWRIDRLKPGQYFWSVQAVDWAFRGSPFSAEQTFTIVEGGQTPPAPTISSIQNVFTDEDTPVEASFTIGPTEALGDLKLTVESSVPTLAPANNVQVIGNGINQTLRIRPGTNQNGIATITVRATDSAGQQAVSTFVLSVFPINDPPFLSPIPNQVVFNNSGPLTIPYVASDIEGDFRFNRVEMSATSSDPSLLPNSAIKFTTDFRGDETFIEIAPPTNKVGSVTIKVFADDGESRTVSSFVMLVLPSQFQDAGTLPGAGVGAAGLAWADFDNDGQLDFLSNLSGAPQMFLNKTTGFIPGFFTFPASFLGATAIADFNRDNYMDVVMVSPDAVRIFLNQNGTNFASAPVGGIPKLQLPTLDIFDVDNDGDLDLMVAGQTISGSFSRRLVINDRGVFGVVNAPLATVGGPVAVGDFDGDGWTDLAFAGAPVSLGGGYGLYRGMGGGQFKFANDFSALMPPSFTGIADIDGDGRLDLFQTSGGILQAHLNESGGFKAETNSFGFTISPRVSGDIDGDGLLDFIGNATTAPTTYATVFLENRRDGQFAAKLNPIPGSMIPVSVADVNSDGLLDLVAVTRSQEATPRLFINSLRNPNPPPGAPQNLQSTVTSNGMVLSWTAAEDINQRGGLTYNVRVGTKSGASDVVSGAALANGTRLLVGAGNAGGRLFMVLTNLTRDTYHWSVQAIDNSFAGGPFAEEEIVHVILPGNLPPTVLPEPALFVGGEDAAGQIGFTLTDDHTAPEDLTLRVFAMDPTLLAFTNISVTVTGATGGIKFRPQTNAFGETQLIIQATDGGGLVGFGAVSVTITNINDAPKISGIVQQFSNGPGDAVTASFSVSDVDDAPDTLNFLVTTSDTATLPVQNISITGSGTNRLVTLFTASPAPANVAVGITVTDPAGASAQSTFIVSFTNRIFKLADTNFPGVRSGQIAWGDFDNDGDLDFVLSGDGLINMGLYINQGDGAFAKASLPLPAPDAPIWKDLNNDGNLDLLISGGATLFSTQGDGTLRRITTGIPNGGAVFGDFDNDGSLDLVKSIDTTSGIPRAYFIENTPAGFVQRNNIFSVNNGYPLNFEDYDLDGRLDLRVARLGATWTNAIYLQRSNVFQLASSPWPGELLLWDDFDNDGLPDAIVNNHPGYGDNGIALFRNQGGKFTDAGSILVAPFFASHISAVDFDNDGYLDVFMNGQAFAGSGAYQSKLFHNERDGNFREVQHPFPNFDSLRVSWADVDNDGDTDALLTAQPTSGPYITWLYKNNQKLRNDPPAAPTGLRATYTTEGLLIEWNESFDPNQNGGLTYNVAVGSGPGTWDIFSPMSAADGYRRVIDKGNAGWRHSKLVTGLAPDQPYVFTVQAIDNSFAGSEFAPIQSIFATTLPQLNAPTLIDGMLQFTLMAPPGQFYILEASSDLKTWTPIISVDNAPVHLQAPIIGTDHRFFRFRVR